MSSRDRALFLAGLALTTLASLALEVLNTRLLSVVTWYHLSFFVVSIGMFGMTAGALEVYFHPERYEGEAARESLARVAGWFALSIPAAHIVGISVPMPPLPPTELAVIFGLLIVITSLALPFYLSGIVVSVALTRIPGPIGMIYFFDLLGAAAGSLLVLPLLELGSVTFAAFCTAAVAAIGAACFAAFANSKSTRSMALMAGVMLAGAAMIQIVHPVLPAYSKGLLRPDAPQFGDARDDAPTDFWTIHGHVGVWPLEHTTPGQWGAGIGSDEYLVDRRMLIIDGDAGTYITGWDGDPASAEWTHTDVVSLPYHLRPGGDVAVIGVGGGRDLLTAIHAGADSVVGVEINRAFIELLTVHFRDFAKIADRPEVTLVHDEARSYLTRVNGEYDLLQMSLIDTWAATGAGAFTLSENGLYTVEAWDVFLNTLKPNGMFSVSRWYSPTTVSETSRLVALATASLLRNGADDPRSQMILVGREHLATLVISREPFTQPDLDRLREACDQYGFEVLLAPGYEPATPLLGKIASSASIEEIHQAVSGEVFDYRPPTDATPFFFNMTYPSTLITELDLMDGTLGVHPGNLFAAYTLVLLIGATFGLVLLVIGGPLLSRGLPDVERPTFWSAVGWFAAIGSGFMLLQIGFMQRFSVFLGHPIYSLSIILCTMILFTGVGSLISDRIPVEGNRTTSIAVSVAAAVTIGIVALVLQPVTEATIHQGLAVRALVTVSVVAPISVLLGMFFPTGMRLLRGTNEAILPWMWGVNGALGVLAGCVAVAVSMWAGINANLWLASALYLSTAASGAVLFRALSERDAR